MIVQTAPLGFSLNPLHYVKKAAHDVAHPISTVKSAAKTVGHGIRHPLNTVEGAAKAAAHVALLPVKEVLHVVNAALKLAFRPVTNRIHTLENRRAAKIAFDKRKSTTPTPAERAEAKSWTKSKLKSEGPHGRVLALFAGPPPRMPLVPEVGMLGQDPATVSIVAASIPVFMALMNAVLKKFSKSGEAPAHPGDVPGGDAAAAAAASSAVAAGGEAAEAAIDAGAGGDDDGGAGGGGGAMVKLPGGTMVKKKTLMIGGAVFGGLVLILLLMPSKKPS